jgi:dTDP-4-dehydrorhamnose reductase
VLRVVDDQIGSPTWTITLSHIIEKIITLQKYGIYHASDLTDNGISRFEFAQEIISLSGSDSTVIAVKSKAFPLPAKRPSYSVLDLRSTCLLMQATPPPWKKSLSKYMEEMNNL